MLLNIVYWVGLGIESGIEIKKKIKATCNEKIRVYINIYLFK